MKRNKRLKKVIMGGVGFAMAVVVFFVGSMQSMQDVSADIRVFDRITEKYPHADNKTFKLNILEIVPGDPATSKEVGYFLTDQKEHISPTRVTHGTVHAAPFDSRANANYANALYNLRTYGLIRPTGADNAGAYPIYLTDNGAAMSAFSNYETTACKNSYDFNFVKGVYELGVGDYNIAEGYTIDDDGRICEMVEVPIVSENSTLSENNPTYNPENNTIIELKPVTDIDMSELSLPKSKTNSELKYVTWVGEENGNLKFTRSETVTDKVEYYGYSNQKLFYFYEDDGQARFKFHSSSFFKEYVLGSRDKYENKNITYTTVKASEVTTNQIANADLIYISGKSADFALEKGDISVDILLELYNQEVNNHKAVMMDYACYKEDATTNVSKLAVLLWQESQNKTRTTYKEAFSDAKDPNKLMSIDFLKGEALRDLKSSMLTGANGNFVTGNVYVYNHHISDYDDARSLIDAGDNFANGDFNSAYTAAAMQAGFTHVLSYITTTNKNSTTGMMLPSVTPAVAIQYILISDGNPLTIVKSSLNVLEIQPVMSFLYNDGRGSEEYGYLEDGSTVKQNRDYFVQNYLGDYYDDKAEYIHFTSMTIDEFNGRNEDLIENYDVIYIGSEMGDLYYTKEMNTAKKVQMTDSETKVLTNKYSSTIETKSLPYYNDSAMDGNVYYNIGDTTKIDTYRLGNFLDVNTDQARFSGRDFTSDKLAKLKAYLDGEHLILVAGDLMGQMDSGVTKINPTAVSEGDNGRIDNSSNMYELLMYAQGYRFNYSSGAYENKTDEGAYQFYENLVSVDDVLNGVVPTSKVDKYVATEKIALALTEKPTEYSYMTLENSQVIDPEKVKYLEESSNGTRELKFEFIISSNVDNSFATAAYVPSLYIDVNNDGKYSKTSENVKDIKIINKGSGEEAEKDESGTYRLYKDVQYQLTRALDDSYNGYLKWKLNVQSTINTNVHASEQGSTVVKNKGEKELIKILQITRTDYSNLDLETQENDEKSKFGKYLANVPGYDVEIKTLKMSDFEKDFMDKWAENKATMSLKEFSLKYFAEVTIVEPTEENKDGLYGADMLVLGFGDDFNSLANTETVTALQTYMENEKPVLLAHDFIMYWSKYSFNDKNRPTYHSMYLRHNVGMDKYGVTQNIKDVSSDKITVAQLVNAQLNPGELNYLHSGVSYTRNEDTSSSDNKKIALIEATGKAVAYKPGSCRGSVLETTQGISNATLMRFTGETKGTEQNGRKNMIERGWLNSDAAETVYYGAGEYTVNRMNEGQITSYPYTLPEKFKVEDTHGQYFQLDLDADMDEDGESDVVVWYTLGEIDKNTFNPTPSGQLNENYDPWNDKVGGPVPSDGYYIYNKGNITYTGAGHENLTNASDTEVQLFVNTLFAAYNAGKASPGAKFFETAPDATTAPITSIAIPYDANVTKKAGAIDSSILKDADGNFRYHFVNPNPNPEASTEKQLATPVYFRLDDTNFVRGKKYMQIEYYLKADGLKKDEEFDLASVFSSGANLKRKVELLNYNNTNVPVVNITDLMATYHVSNNAFTTKLGEGDLKALQSGVPYGFYLPLTYLNEKSQVVIYIKAKTKIYTVSSQTNQETVEDVPGEGVSSLTITKADLLDLD